MKRKAGILTSLLLLLSLPFYTGCAAQETQPGESSSETAQSPGDLTVQVLDVGQGLSILAESDGHYLLYDGGDRGASSFVVAYLEDQGVTELDYVVASHYDADHISGLVGALNVYDTEVVLAPDYETDSQIYDSFQEKAAAQGLTVTHPEPGDSYELGNASFTVLSPIQDEYSDDNDYSVAIRLEDGDTSFLFTGDASVDSEAEMIASGEALQSDVLVLGHHGSSTSSSGAFLDAVDPSAAVVSCGLSNSYGHPHREIMEAIQSRGCDLYRTDLQGTLTAVSDGSSITWSAQPCTDYRSGEELEAAGVTEKDSASAVTPTAAPSDDSSENTESVYILNTRSKKFHRPSCDSVGTMSDKNKEESSLSREELIEQGYSPCQNCNP